MSPLYANRFAGHLESGDPRTPMQGAGGCPWPTIPPHRVQFSSTDATGQFVFLRTFPVILEQVASPFHHTLLTYESIESPPEVYNWTLYKTYDRESYPEYSWYLIIMLVGWPAEVPYAKFVSGPCNRDVVWGDIGIPYGVGSPGSHFIQFQVEYDQMRAPDWRPPA